MYTMLVLSAHFQCVAGPIRGGRVAERCQLFGENLLLDFGEETQVKERRKTKRRKDSSCQQVCIGKVTRERCQRPSTG